MSKLLVKDIMRQNPPYVTLGTQLNDVVDVLLKNKVLGIPVLNDQQQVIGFVSEQNCIHSLLVNSYHHEGATLVDDVMFTEPLTVAPDDSIVDLAQRMTVNKPKNYPVVFEGRLVGLITRSDVMKALRKAQKDSRAFADKKIA